jgi:hypothetical protein
MPQTSGRQLEMADHYYREAADRQNREYRAVTIDNYRRIADTLKKRVVALVCVQYPMRSVEPLKKILSGREGLIFVDNSEVFREDVKRKGFRHYFTDCFGGVFGHCTPAGNRLLAENIADSILNSNFIRPQEN